MKYTGFSAYDDQEFFENYHKRRDRKDAPNEAIEQPIIDDLLGDVAGKTILDLGCGDGKYGAELLIRGAKSYHGIEGSINMAKLAKENLADDYADIEVADIESVEITGKYDIVISRLVFHYLEDLDSVFNKVTASLHQNGSFIFSVEHPVITSHYESYHDKGKRGNWIVDNYFDAGARINHWHGKQVVKYHKSLEEYWRIIKQANLEVAELRESKPLKKHFDNEAEYLRRMRIPLFLIFKLKLKTQS